jgi:Subtilase family
MASSRICWPSCPVQDGGTMLNKLILPRSICVSLVGTLVLASCMPAEQQTDEAQQSDELDGTPQEPHAAVCNGGRFRCKARVRVDEHNRIKPFVTPVGLGPVELAEIYRLKPNPEPWGIVLIDAFNYANAESDLATYRSQFGLPPCTKANGCLTIVNQNGAVSPLPAAPPAGDDWNLEAALDLDMASAACPSCRLALVEAQDDQGNGLFIAQNAAAALPGMDVISNSWGESSPGNENTLDTQFFNHTQAITTFVSSGDSGNTGAAGDYPSTSTHVIAVGGTHVVKSSTARGWTETAWSGAGSTCSRVISKPSFQSVIPTGTCSRRAAADVSAVADPNTGVAVFNAKDGGWVVVGGTSASSPFVAGVYARYGIAPTANHDASFAYAHTSEFFDITSGSNGTCTTALCRAAIGWDGPTGVGSPNGAVLSP